MKKLFTQLLALTLLVVAGTTAQAQVVVLWGGEDNPNSTFDGGLNDWEAPVGTALGEDDEDAVWIWAADANAGSGAYAAASTVIASPTFENGAALFNSDFLDNNGVQGDFGAGPAPAPQEAELISPVIDLTGVTDDISIAFYQRYRNFMANPAVSYSNDGGTTWSDLIPVNEGIEVNAATGNGDFEIVNLPADAGDTDQFRFKFVWQGDYYYWLIDDVSIIETPRTDLVLDGWLYPFASYATPQEHLGFDTVAAFAQIINIGADAQTNFTTFFDIFEIDETTDPPSLGNLVFSDSLTATETIANGDTLEVRFPNTSFDFLTPQRYAFRYTVDTDTTGGVSDITPDDNVVAEFFEVTDSLFQKTPRATFGTRPAADGGYVVGSDFLMSDMADLMFLTADSVYAAIDVDPAEFPDGLPDNDFGLFLLRIIPEEFIASGDNSEWFQNPGLEIVGSTTINFAGVDPLTRLGAAWNNELDADSPLELEPGVEYRVVFPFDDPFNTVEMGYSRIIDYGEFNSPSPIYVNQQWFGGFTSNPVAALELQLRSETMVNVAELDAANKFEVTPNPATDLVQVNLELVDVAPRAVVVLMDVNGRLVEAREFTNLRQEGLRFDVSELAAGTYFVRLATDAGVRVEKLTVVK